MNCDNCDQKLSVCDNCSKPLVQFACMSVIVSGQAAQQLGVPDGTGHYYHWCPKCVQDIMFQQHIKDGNHRSRI
jgi:hypothetical protein